jgi:putative hydrolase of the HAD superfamily
MAEVLGEPVEKVMEKAERLIYRGWEPHFKKIRLFPHVRETLEAFRNAGIKLGLLSDFPPEIKLENLGILEFWDTIVCSERVGCLKPHPASFLELAGRMETVPEQILYVGNSVSYDVAGACGAGMKAALIRTKFLSGTIGSGEVTVSGRTTADFCFSDYRQLRDYVLS